MGEKGREWEGMGGNGGEWGGGWGGMGRRMGGRMGGRMGRNGGGNGREKEEPDKGQNGRENVANTDNIFFRFVDRITQKANKNTQISCGVVSSLGKKKKKIRKKIGEGIWREKRRRKGEKEKKKTCWFWMVC